MRLALYKNNTGSNRQILQREDKKLLYQHGEIEKGERCFGFSFRLRSSSYDGTRQLNIYMSRETETLINRIAKADFFVNDIFCAGVDIIGQFQPIPLI
jgi:hypothetical protein